jgi:hypothetical protein
LRENPVTVPTAVTSSLLSTLFRGLADQVRLSYLFAVRERLILSMKL